MQAKSACNQPSPKYDSKIEAKSIIAPINRFEAYEQR